METYIAFLWLGLLVASVFAEVMTSALVAIWFMPGALVSMILAMLKVPVWIQGAVFFVLSVLLLVFGRRLFKSFFPKSKDTPTNVDALIGKEAVIIEAVNNLEARGAAKLNGQVWSARAEQEDQELLPGDVVIVKAIHGVKLICQKK